MLTHQYYLYPTILDSFYWLKRAKADQYAEKEQELINKINKVPMPMPPAALKGVQFEDCVNKRLDGIEVYATPEHTFNAELINRIAAKLINCTGKQKWIETIISTPMGPVRMGGFVDYTYPTMYVDLKTTGSYKPGKYKANAQHRTYPLISQLNGGRVTDFNYLVTDFNDIYIEPYAHTAEMRDSLIYDMVEFLEWVESKRHLITDNKIFGGRPYAAGVGNGTTLPKNVK